jgi:putative transcriptional regulator
MESSDFRPSAMQTEECYLSLTQYVDKSIALLALGERAAVKEQFIRYRPGIDPKPPSRTDWERVDRMTDEEVEAAALADPDAQPLTDEELTQCFRPGVLRMVRERLGLDQAAFARRFCIEQKTLEAWETGRGVPTEAERAYLKVIERNPEAVLAALDD